MTADEKTCSSCGTTPAGPGGILCTSCAERISARTVADWYPAATIAAAAADASEEPQR